MKQRSRVADPRAVLFLGILIALSAGLTVREIVGPGARFGATINRALADSERGEAERAFVSLRRVVDARPESADSWARAGRALVPIRPLEAAEYFHHAIELDPGSPRLRYEFARALARGGSPGEAWDALEEVFSRKSDHADALTLAAALAASRGEVEHAVAFWEAALAAGPSDPDRVRRDPWFDPVRSDRRFVEAVLALRVPGTFVAADEPAS